MTTELFEELADNAPVMIWRSRLDKLCDFFNKSWLDFRGRTQEEEFGMGWAEGVHPDDFNRCLSTYTAAFDANEEFSMEYRLRRHDGAYRWILDNGKPFYRDGQFAGYFGSCLDITEHKEAEEAHNRLIAELNHRVKNTLSTVQSLVSLTLRGSATIEEAKEHLTSRIMAIAQAHEAISENAWRGVPLKALVNRIADVHKAFRPRIEISGNDAMISAASAQSLAMALNELFLNAIEHGALAAQGQVHISWRGSGQWLELRWDENGGPPVAANARNGLGWRLIKTMLPSDIGGDASFEQRPEGLTCLIKFPLPAT